LVNLKKGTGVSLAKAAKDSGISKLTKVSIGLGWDINRFGTNFDLDAWALVAENGVVRKSGLVYYMHISDKSRCINHMGDNLTGEGDGDDETINIDLEHLPESYTNIIIGVTIFAANRRSQTFEKIDNTFIRIYDTRTGIEICKYADKFRDDLGKFATMLFGVLSKQSDGTWRFDTLGVGSKVSSISNVVSVGDSYLQYINNNNAVANNTAEQERGNFMAVSLSKGGKVSLAKVASDAGIDSLTKIRVGLGWDVNRYDGGADFDLDASAFICGADNKVRNEKDFIFYNNKESVDGATVHTGDNRTGEGEGDDETLVIDLTKVDPSVEKINFTVTIDQADKRNQSFGMVENSYIRIVDETSGTELIKYDLGEDFSVETAIVVAQLYKHNGEWKFNAIGSGFAGGLAALCANFGIDAE
jgi:tellurium resistance protein TerD